MGKFRRGASWGQRMSLDLFLVGKAPLEIICSLLYRSGNRSVLTFKSCPDTGVVVHRLLETLNHSKSRRLGDRFLGVAFIGMLIFILLIILPWRSSQRPIQEQTSPQPGAWWRPQRGREVVRQVWRIAGLTVLSGGHRLKPVYNNVKSISYGCYENAFPLHCIQFEMKRNFPSFKYSF